MQFCIYHKKIYKLIYCTDFTQTGFSYSGILLLIETVSLNVNIKTQLFMTIYYILIEFFTSIIITSTNDFAHIDHIDIANWS